MNNVQHEIQVLCVDIGHTPLRLRGGTVKKANTTGTQRNGEGHSRVEHNTILEAKQRDGPGVFSCVV